MTKKQIVVKGDVTYAYVLRSSMNKNNLNTSTIHIDIIYIDTIYIFKQSRHIHRSITKH